MDNNILRINMDGSNFVEGEPPKPTLKTVRLVGNGPDAITHEQMQQRRNQARDNQGRLAWSKLHGYKGCDPQWLEIWEMILPKHCGCQVDYQAYKNSSPPDFTSPESLWLWGVALHNHVNRKLGKPELTVDEARLQWSRSDDLEHKQG